MLLAAKNKLLYEPDTSDHGTTNNPEISSHLLQGYLYRFSYDAVVSVWINQEEKTREARTWQRKKRSWREEQRREGIEWKEERNEVERGEKDAGREEGD